MKKWIVPFLAAFVLLACNLPFTITMNTPTVLTPAVTIEVVTATPTSQQVEPTATIAATATTAFNGVEKNLGGVYMAIPACLASDATGIIMPEVIPTENEYPAYNPAYRKISLIGYPLSNKFWQPVVQVYPVARFIELVPDMANTVTKMQQILADKPAEFQTAIPVVQVPGAAQVFHARVGYLNFKNGQGIGFLTEYAQYYAPVNNHDLFYTYQGLTADGKYWISIFLPVNAAYLQASYNEPAVPADGIAAPDENSNNLENEMKTYYVNMVQKLNNTEADAFTPSLSCIAQFVQSLNVGD